MKNLMRRSIATLIMLLAMFCCVQTALAAKTSYGVSGLSETSQKVYAKLLSKVTEIAEKGGSTEISLVGIEFPFTYNYDPTMDEAEEKKSYSAAAADAFTAQIAPDKLLSCLLTNSPYEFYWFDKTSNTAFRYVYGINYHHGKGTVSNIRVSLDVIPAYQDNSDVHKVSSTAAAKVQSGTVAKAKAIVAANKNKSDLEKLDAYRQAICDLVSYNYDASNDIDKDPRNWQLDFVFDGDPTTNVVCEGYSKAFKYLCDLTDFSGNVSCSLVTGTMRGGTGEGPHMWNLVSMNGKNYLVDVTNCDGDGGPINSIGYPDKLFMTAYPKGNDSFASSYTLEFKSFAGSDCSINYSYDGKTISLYSNKDLTLSSKPVPVYYAIKVSTDGNGNASATPTSAEADTKVTLTATPNTGYHLVKWQVVSGGVTVNKNNNTFTMLASNVEVKAIFAKTDYSITVRSDSACGTASASSATAQYGETVTLSATPAVGYRLDRWDVVEGNVKLNGDAFSMPAENVIVEATFSKIKYPISLTKEGEGEVSSDLASAEMGATVTLTATPAIGYTFAGWDSAVTIDENTNQFTMPANHVEVKATFEAIPYTVTVGTSEHGEAVASATSATIGTEVTLTVTPDAGYELKDWTVYPGTVKVTDNKFTMPAADLTVTPVFGKIIYTVQMSDSGNGTVTMEPATPEVGDTVTLTVTPKEGYLFIGWQVVSGSCSIANNQFVMPAGNVEIKAIFTPIAPTTYAVQVTDDGNGKAQADIEEAEAGATVKLTATPKEGYLFKAWEVLSGGVTIANDQFTMPASPVSVKAIFAPLPKDLILQQPSEQAVLEGEKATFSVKAEGTNVTYQWYIDRNDGKGWLPLEGATGSTYTTSVTNKGNNGFKYYCLVRSDENPDGIASSTVTLRVAEPPVVPTTGDSSHIELWMMLFLLAGVLLVGMNFRGNKRREN